MIYYQFIFVILVTLIGIFSKSRSACIEKILDYTKQMTIICSDIEFKEGWKIFSIKNKIRLEEQIKYNISNSELFYLSGVLEGISSFKDMENQYINVNSTLYNFESFNIKLNNYIDSQYLYISALSQEINSDDKIYSEALQTTIKQFDGLYHGYEIAKKSILEVKYQNNIENLLLNERNQNKYSFYLDEGNKIIFNKEEYDFIFNNKDRNDHEFENILLSKKQIYYLSMIGDLGDLTLAFQESKESIKENREDIYINHFKNLQCTIFSKLIYDENNHIRDLIISHNTHNIYSLMNRYYKEYNLDLVFEHNRNKRINGYSFTSRPGDLNSKDDYYITTANLIVTETSLEILNK